ncbi:MAG: adenylosuccinate synthetase [Flavonifractor plautii]
MFAEGSDVVVRFQGGANAGPYHHLRLWKICPAPAALGVFYPHITNIIGNGVALNVPKFLEELQHLRDGGVPAPISSSMSAPRCSCPTTSFRTSMRRSGWAVTAFGSTKSGIAPSIPTSTPKYGIQICELFDEPRLMERLEQVCAIKNVLFEHLYHKPQA